MVAFKRDENELGREKEGKGKEKRTVSIDIDTEEFRDRLRNIAMAAAAIEANLASNGEGDLPPKAKAALERSRELDPAAGDAAIIRDFIAGLRDFVAAYMDAFEPGEGPVERMNIEVAVACLADLGIMGSKEEQEAAREVVQKITPAIKDLWEKKVGPAVDELAGEMTAKSKAEAEEAKKRTLEENPGMHVLVVPPVGEPGDPLKDEKVRNFILALALVDTDARKREREGRSPLPADMRSHLDAALEGLRSGDGEKMFKEADAFGLAYQNRYDSMDGDAPLTPTSLLSLMYAMADLEGNVRESERENVENNRKVLSEWRRKLEREFKEREQGFPDAI